MELSNEISFGLKRLANTSVVSEENFDKLLSGISSYLENPLSKHHSVGIENSAARVDVLKESYASLITFFVESIRKNVDIVTLKTVLLEHKLNESRIEQILEVYTKHKLSVRNVLKKYNSDPPSLMGVSWKLNYCVKSSFSDFDGKCLYFIEMQVTDNKRSPEGTNKGVISFVCTVQQLQSLVASLRAAVRQLEAVANVAK